LISDQFFFFKKKDDPQAHQAQLSQKEPEAQNTPAKLFGSIQVTDGWYCINAFLDEKLTERLATGSLFIGMKLSIFGATVSLVC
jgi:hypothetical protein